LPDRSKGKYGSTSRSSVRAYNEALVAAARQLRTRPLISQRCPNILDAVQNPNWFGLSFKEPSWGGWKVFLAALFGLPMTEHQADLFRQFSGRQTPPTAPTREAWVVVGRRGGKSSIAALLATYLAVSRDYTPYLAHGEVATIPVIAADRRGARTCLNYIKGFIHSIPAIKLLVKEERVSSVEFNNRVLIEIHTCSFRTVRGYTMVNAICDEIGFWRTDQRAKNRDKEVIRALRPCMATIPGSSLIALSSPYERRGALFENYEEHFGREADPVLVWKASTREMNPAIDPRVIENEYANDAAAASAEYGGEFPRNPEFL
jgi:hypothetical protein